MAVNFGGGNVLIASNSDNGQAIVQIGGSNNTKLSLKDGTSQNGMRWESVGGANAFYLFNGTFGTAGWGLYNITTAATPFWVTNGGNFGIGLNNPQSLLHINGALSFTEVGYDTVRRHRIESGHSDGSSINNNF